MNTPLRSAALTSTPYIPRPALLGVTRAALASESFLAAAGFQETTGVLADAALEPGATGALLFGPPARPVGTVFLEEGRVCWAATAGMNRRLTDLPPSQPIRS